ncbi:MAG: hypothetical protein JNK05_17020 [Myxococcales bacterium]|nr:hypothetical protein [Myxococcales bacterium]
MTFVLPHPSDPPSVWRAVAAQFAGDDEARAALLAAADAGSDALAHAVWPALVARTRGRAHDAAVSSVAARARDRRAGPGVVWSLASVLLGPRDALRPLAAKTLASPAFERDRVALSLALSLAARVTSARGATARERAALSAWVALDGEDPLAECDSDATWRAWIEGRERPAQLDYALVLACAGARRAELEHLRALAEHVVRLFGTASPATGALWRWLATGGADGAEDDGAGRSSWAESGPRVVATSALSTVRPAAALTMLAPQAEHGGAFDRAVLVHVLRACAAEARARREDERTLSWAVLAAQADERLADQAALDRAVELLCESLARCSQRSEAIVELLLGRESTVSAARSPSDPAAGPWLSPALRVRALGVALANEALGARSIALGELAQNGVVPGVLALLRDVVKSDPDPITRQQARSLMKLDR